MQVSSDVRIATNRDGSVLMDIKQGRIFSVNSTGICIWEHLCAGRPADEIADRFVTEFGISRVEALNDISEFIQGLQQQRLLQFPENSTSQLKTGTKLRNWLSELSVRRGR
jgi:hypothetical protein